MKAQYIVTDTVSIVKTDEGFEVSKIIDNEQIKTILSRIIEWLLNRYLK